MLQTELKSHCFPQPQLLSLIRPFLFETQSLCCPSWGLIWLQEDSISCAKQCWWSQHWFSYHAGADFQRGQMQAVVSREQLFSSSFLFFAQFHINYMIMSCFQGTGNVSHRSAVDLPIWHNLCTHDFPARILLCDPVVFCSKHLRPVCKLQPADTCPGRL